MYMFDVLGLTAAKPTSNQLRMQSRLHHVHKCQDALTSLPVMQLSHCWQQSLNQPNPTVSPFFRCVTPDPSCSTTPMICRQQRPKSVRAAESRQHHEATMLVGDTEVNAHIVAGAPRDQAPSDTCICPSHLWRREHQNGKVRCV